MGEPTGRLAADIAARRSDDSFMGRLQGRLREDRTILDGLSGRCWLDEDGQHVWWEHDCTEDRVRTMLPWPKWQASPDGRVVPSLDCRACGCHAFFRIEATGASS